jgi:hypothetical protein
VKRSFEPGPPVDPVHQARCGLPVGHENLACGQRSLSSQFGLQFTEYLDCLLLIICALFSAKTLATRRPAAGGTGPNDRIRSARTDRSSA